MKTLLLIILLLGSNIIKAQQFDFIAYGLSYNKLDGTGWADWLDTSVDITIDLDNQTIKIYAKTYKEFQILKWEKELDHTNDTEDFLITARDKTKDEFCKLTLVKYNSNNKKELYIQYPHIHFVYRIYANY